MTKKQKSLSKKQKRIIFSVVVILLVLTALTAIVLVSRNENNTPDVQKVYFKTQQKINIEEQLLFDCFLSQNNDWTSIELLEKLDIEIITSLSNTNIEELMTESINCVNMFLEEWSLNPKIINLSSINITITFNGTGEQNKSFINKIVALK